MAASFNVEVEGIGAFIFRKRTIRDQFRIEAEASRVLGGPVDDDLLRGGATAYATLLILTTEAPEGWDLDSFDPLDPDATGRVFLVHRRLREAEATFRGGAVQGGPGKGAGAL